MSVLGLTPRRRPPVIEGVVQMQGLKRALFLMGAAVLGAALALLRTEVPALRVVTSSSNDETKLSRLAAVVRARFDGLLGRCPGFREHPPSLAKFAIQLSSRRTEMHVLGARFVSVVRGAPIAENLSACAAATLGMPVTQSAKAPSALPRTSGRPAVWPNSRTSRVCRWACRRRGR